MWDLPHAQASLLFQLRMGHVPLQKHLYRIGKVSFLCAQLVGCKMSQCFTIFSCALCTESKRENGMVTTASSTLCCTLLAKPQAFTHLFWYISTMQCFCHFLDDCYKWVHCTTQPRDRVTKGFQTVASAHALHQPTIVGPSISRIVIHKFGT